MPRLAELVRDVVEGRVPQPPVARLVGFRLVEARDGATVVEADVDARHHNPMGTLHGGVLCDIADAAMGMAHATTLGDGQTFTTIEIKANFVRPVVAGHLRAEARMVKTGRTISLAECRVEDAEGRLVATVTSTLMTLRDADRAP